MTVISYINNMCDIKSDSFNKIARSSIWGFCIIKTLWISAAHITGASNEEADNQSRIPYDVIEWQINQKFFKKIYEKFLKPDIDL